MGYWTFPGIKKTKTNKQYNSKSSFCEALKFPFESRNIIGRWLLLGNTEQFQVFVLLKEVLCLDGS